MEKCPKCGTGLMANPATEKANVGSYYLLTIAVALPLSVIGSISDENNAAAVLSIIAAGVGLILALIAASRGFTIRKNAHFSCAKCDWNSLDHLWVADILPDGSKDWVKANKSRRDFEREMAAYREQKRLDKKS